MFSRTSFASARNVGSLLAANIGQGVHRRAADDARRFAISLSTGRQACRQAVEQWLDPGIKAGTQLGIADQGHRAQDVADTLDRSGRQRPGLIGPVIGGDQTGKPELAKYGQAGTRCQFFQLAANRGQLPAVAIGEQPGQLDHRTLARVVLRVVAVAKGIDQGPRLAVAGQPGQVG